MLGQRGLQWRWLPTWSTGGLHLALFFCHPKQRGRAGLWTQVCSRTRAPKPVPVSRSRCPGAACSAAAPGGLVSRLASEASLGCGLCPKGSGSRKGRQPGERSQGCCEGWRWVCRSAGSAPGARPAADSSSPGAQPCLGGGGSKVTADTEQTSPPGFQSSGPLQCSCVPCRVLLNISKFLPLLRKMKDLTSKYLFLA